MLTIFAADINENINKKRVPIYCANFLTHISGTLFSIFNIYQIP